MIGNVDVYHGLNHRLEDDQMTEVTLEGNVGSSSSASTTTTTTTTTSDDINNNNSNKNNGGAPIIGPALPSNSNKNTKIKRMEKIEKYLY